MRDSPLNIAYFTNALERGGAEEHILTLLRGLDRNRFRPYLVCPALVAEKLAADLPQDVKLVRLCLRKPRQVGAAMRLARLIRQNNIQIVHSHLFYSSLFASPIAWLCRVPVIIETPHLSERWRQGWKAHFFVDRAAGWFVDRYIAVSHANAKYLIETKRLTAQKIVVIQNGSDMRRFAADRSAPPEMKKNLGFAATDPVLVSLARLEPQKGHAVLLEAVARAKRDIPNLRVVCVGDGRLRGELEQQSAALGLNGSARFVGYQSNVPDWLALADATVLSSFFEGLPLVAIESLAAGRPVVATAVDGTPEVVVDGQTGLTVPPGNPSALANALCSLLLNPGLRQRLRQNGTAWVREHFDQQRQVEKTQELYLKAWQEGKRGVRGA